MGERRRGGTTVYLLRHAESTVIPALPESDWPLSEAGVQQAGDLRACLEPLGVDHVVSSPFVRAVDTVRPFCEAAGIELRVDHDLRERRLSGQLIRDFEGTLRKTWEDFDLALPGGESSRACQERVAGCISRLAAAAQGQTLLVSSHGNAIALFLNMLDPAFGWSEWRAMRNPDLFRIRLDGPCWGPVVRL
ncbi:MAG: histidine phosphatase family protein [Gammaproteobacteria bacterium]|nr:histidine phosphatase family protein [Gammaproteobacteria bacterium]